MVRCDLLMANTDQFMDWLQGELDQRSWNESELSRQAALRGYRVSPSTLTRIAKGERGVGPKMAAAIAIALGLPQSVVFEKAGLLDPGPDFNPRAERLNALYDQLTPEDQDEMIAIAEMKLRKKAEREAARHKGKPLGQTE